MFGGELVELFDMHSTLIKSLTFCVARASSGQERDETSHKL